MLASKMGLASSELGLMRSYHSLVLYWMQKIATAFVRHIFG